MRAKINNEILKVKVIDPEYNNYAKEVVILEGNWKGYRAIVENKDIIELNTYSKLVKFIKGFIDTEELEDYHFCELIDNDIYNIIKEFASQYNITNSEYYKLIDIYSNYNDCTSIDEVKTNIIIDTIQQTLNGIKSSFTKIKKENLL
ncbi:hypothetical protein [Clostridium sardiniense]|uniref:hypothetical protein n=1 Tax=Clostridium sardiniense TaxID=29369 RepID=UPI00195AC7B7|nr:hypothetical protein [Clostridium sardiniense]MBM7836302.1 hypothetical protein [Clostridium sardiniense]